MKILRRILEKLLKKVIAKDIAYHNRRLNAQKCFQKEILDRLIDNIATEADYECANNITRKRYADIIFMGFTDTEKCHFMFHTSKDFNGFSDGECNKSCLEKMAKDASELRRDRDRKIY